MTDLEQQITDHLRRRAAAATPRYDLEGIEEAQADASNNRDGAVMDLTTAQRRRRPSRWLAVAAMTALLAIVGAFALLEDHQTVDTTPATDSPVVTEPRIDEGPTTIAHGQDVKIGGLGELAGRTLNIDAVEQDGVVTGEFRINNVVVTLQCADTSFGARDLILGGEVTDDPDGDGLVYHHSGGAARGRFLGAFG